MTVSFPDLALYSTALLALFLTPGPVWLALSARALSGGFAAAWPLAFGVLVGDAVWPLLAIFGVTWIAQEFSGFLTVLRFVGVAVFWIMGANLILHADRGIARDGRLTAPGIWAGFLAGLAAILGNPKAILSYMGVLPGFFDLTGLTPPDIAVIVGLSMAVPFLGNLGFAMLVGRARRLLTTPATLRRANRIAGAMLIAVGCLIPFT